MTWYWRHFISFFYPTLEFVADWYSPSLNNSYWSEPYFCPIWRNELRIFNIIQLMKLFFVFAKRWQQRQERTYSKYLTRNCKLFWISQDCLWLVLERPFSLVGSMMTEILRDTSTKTCKQIHNFCISVSVHHHIIYL